MRLTILIFIGMVLSCGLCRAAQPAGDEILGVYKAIGAETGAVSKVQFYKVGNGYEAKIIWLEQPNDAAGKPLYDILNPDAELRKVRADNIILIRNLRYEDDNSWGGGTVYNPVAGKTYDVVIEFDSPTLLKVRGYVGSTMFGQNFYWEKIE